MELRKKQGLQVRGKLTLFVSALMLGTILILTGIFYVKLDKAYQSWINTRYESYDDDVKTAVQSLVSMLEVNYKRYESGEISEQDARKNAESIVRDTRYNNGEGYFWADTSTGLCAVHMNPDYEGKERYNDQDVNGNYYVQSFIKNGSNPEGGFTDFYFTKPGQDGVFPKRAYTMKFAPYDWYISTGNYIDDINSMVAGSQKEKVQSLLTMLVVSAILCAAGILGMSALVGRITVTLNPIAGRLKLLADGDVHTPPVSVKKTNDEMEVLAQATDELINQMREVVRGITRHLESMSKGDLTLAVEAEYKGDFAPIHASLILIYGQLNKTLHVIRRSAEQVNAGASQVADAAQTLASGTAEQAETVEALSAFITEVSSQIEQNSAHIDEATGHMEQAVGRVEESNDKMQQMLTAMDEIKMTSGEISRITQDIEGIASQTSLLALNAAVEAARAGEAGKGFAIVADEVRSLASKAAEAAKRTALLVDNSSRAVGEGLNIAQENAAILVDVTNQAKHVQALMENVEEASRKQAAAISQATCGITQISAVVQSNAATAEESSASSQELSAQASLLRQEIGRFKIADEAE